MNTICVCVHGKYSAIPAFCFHDVTERYIMLENRCIGVTSEPPDVFNFNQLGVSLHPLKCLILNFVMTLNCTIVGFMLNYMEYYRGEIFKGPHGSVFLIHLRYVSIIRLQRRQTQRVACFSSTIRVS